MCAIVTMPRSATLYVTNLATHVRSKDLAYEFERYGRLRRCDIPSGKNFAFIEYDDERDAEEALDSMHGRRFEGRALVVEVLIPDFSHFTTYTCCIIM